MLDRAGYSDDLFRFSTTTFQWEQLDAALVSGSPPSARWLHAMTTVDNDIIVFGGETDSGEDARLLATVWGHVRYRSDDCSAHLCARGRMVSSGVALPVGTRVGRHSNSMLAPCVAADTP